MQAIRAVLSCFCVSHTLLVAYTHPQVPDRQTHQLVGVVAAAAVHPTTLSRSPMRRLLANAAAVTCLFGAPTSDSLVVLRPSDIAGNYYHVSATFGPALPEQGVYGNISIPVPADACTDLLNGPDVAGTVVLAIRGARRTCKLPTTHTTSNKQQQGSKRTPAEAGRARAGPEGSSIDTAEGRRRRRQA